MSEADRRRWASLALLCAVQFMVVLDVAIVNVALPSIQSALGFSESGLQWVVSAYTLTFGGLMLLGGRAADLLGRRRVFLVGLAVFSLASLACALAQSDTWLIIARAVQGSGAAIISPAALSIVMTTFAEGRERNKALGIWGAIAGVGGAVGVLLGGVLTDALSWEWIFFINVPVGFAVLALGPRLLKESRVEGATRHFDLFGALTVTAQLVLLVYALVEAPEAGWASLQTIGLLALSGALLVAFLLIEHRSVAPLVPLGLFRNRSLTGGNVVGFLLGASIFAMFFFLSLYMQQVLGYSPLRTGIAYLAIAVTIVLSAGASQALVTRLGVKPVLLTGMILTLAGLLWFTQVSVDGSYWVDLLPGFLVSGVGLGFAFVPVTIAALSGVTNREAGVASGIINTSQQIGGAVGVAILSTVATTRTATALAAGESQLSALTSGFAYAFAVGAGMALLGVIATVALVSRRVRVPQAEVGGTPVPVAAGAE